MDEAFKTANAAGGHAKLAKSIANLSKVFLAHVLELVNARREQVGYAKRESVEELNIVNLKGFGSDIDKQCWESPIVATRTTPYGEVLYADNAFSNVSVPGDVVETEGISTVQDTMLNL